jgi:DNA ligase (NAD+)
VAEKLVERGFVDEPLDLFTLDLQKLAKLNLGTEAEPRLLGEKNAAKLLAAVARARTAPLAKWLHALAIPEIGQETAYDLAKYYPDLPTLACSSLLRDTAQLGRICRKFEENKVGKKERPSLSENEIEGRKQKQNDAKLTGNPIGRRLIEADFAKPADRSRASDWKARTLIGAVAAASIVNWFEGDLGRNVLRRMTQLGLSPIGETQARKKVPDSASRPFDGKTFVITGTLSAISRENAGERIRQLGGNVTGAVSKNTDFLVVGIDAGSKLAKAKALGIKTLTELEFLKMADLGGDAHPHNPLTTLL